MIGRLRIRRNSSLLSGDHRVARGQIDRQNGCERSEGYCTDDVDAIFEQPLHDDTTISIQKCAPFLPLVMRTCSFGRQPVLSAIALLGGEQKAFKTDDAECNEGSKETRQSDEDPALQPIPLQCDTAAQAALLSEFGPPCVLSDCIMQPVDAATNNIVTVCTTTRKVQSTHVVKLEYHVLRLLVPSKIA